MENLKIKNLILKEHLKVKLENKKSSIGSAIMEEEYGFKKKLHMYVTALTSLVTSVRSPSLGTPWLRTQALRSPGPVCSILLSGAAFQWELGT